MLDFNGVGAMNYAELVVLFISLGTSLACILRVKASYREQNMIDMTNTLFKSLGRKVDSPLGNSYLSIYLISSH